MKKISSLILAFLCIGSVVAQVEFDRPEAFLFERKNPLRTRIDSLNNEGDTVATKRKQFSVDQKTDYTGYFSVYGSAFVNSNSITNSFIKAYSYTYSYIDDDLKQQQVDRFKSSNRIGSDSKAGLYGQYKLGNIRVEAGLNYRNFNSAQFSADAFKLVFYGNSMYAGKTASLTPLNMYNLNNQSLYVGVKKNIGKKQNMTLGARVAFIRGGRLQKINSKNLSLYTASDGSYLTLNGKFNIAYTDDSTYATIPPMHGAGVSTDLFYSVRDERNELTVELLDLGFIRWNDVVTYSGDGSYTYSGIAIDNIFTTGSLNINPVNLNTILENMGITKEVKDMTYMLPATLNIAYYRHMNPKLTLSGGVRQQFVAGYVPRVYAKAAYYIKKDFVIVPTLAYGGFGRADVELGISKSFADHIILSTHLQWFEYLAAPAKTSGQGMSLAFSYYF